MAQTGHPNQQIGRFFSANSHPADLNQHIDSGL
jgi:hypothetical protein